MSSSAAAISSSATRCSTFSFSRRTRSSTPMKRRPIAARRQYRAAEQLHLAEEVDLDLRRRAARDRRAWRVQPRGIKDTRTFLIAALPLSLGYDGSDSLLDPTTRFPAERPDQPRNLGAWRQLHLCPHPDRRERLSSRVGQRRRRRADPARDDRRRRSLRHRAVAALLFGRRRVGARLRLSAARAQGRRRRSDRRPRPGRVRARSAHSPEAVRRQFRRRAILRRRLADDQGDAGLQQLALRGRASAFAIIRASGRSASMSACRSTARRATGRSRSPSRSDRPSDGRGGRPNAQAPHRRRGRLRRDWRWRLLNELFALFVALLFLLAGAAGAARQRARPPLHRRPAQRLRDRLGPARSASGGSTGRSSASRSCGTSRSPTSTASS